MVTIHNLVWLDQIKCKHSFLFIYKINCLLFNACFCAYTVHTVCVCVCRFCFLFSSFIRTSSYIDACCWYCLLITLRYASTSSKTFTLLGGERQREIKRRKKTLVYDFKSRKLPDRISFRACKPCRAERLICHDMYTAHTYLMVNRW